MMNPNAGHHRFIKLPYDEQGDKIREIDSIQARLAAIEITSSEIRGELQRLSEKSWKETAAWVSAFLLFMGFIITIQNTLRVADQNYSVVGITHNEEHLNKLELQIKELRIYTDERIEQIRSVAFTKSDHEIFDKERSAEAADFQNRLAWIEHNIVNKVQK